MDNIWSQVQDLRAAVRQLREEHDALQAELQLQLDEVADG
jgi:hypothetical protein